LDFLCELYYDARIHEHQVMRKYQSTLEASWPKFQTTDLLHKQESEKHSVSIRISEQN